MIDFNNKEFKELLHNLKKAKKEYSDLVEYADRMAVHAYGEKPIDILERFRPREDPQVREYRIQTYEPKTKSKFDEALKVMKKMFNPSLFSITFPESEASETLEQYLVEDYPVRNSLINYLKEEGLKYVISNPNGLFCVLPGDYVEENEFRKPVLKFYKEHQIAYFDEEVLIIHKYGEIGKNATYLIIDDTNYYKVVENRDSQKIVFEIEEERPHNLGEIPAWFAGGIVEGHKYVSFFDPAISFWNKAIAHDSDLDGVLVNHSYPHMWAVEIDCTNEGCIGGKVKNIKGDGTHESLTCTTCHGTGKTMSKSPYDYFSVNESKLNDNPAIAPPAGYITAPTDIIKMLDEKVEKLFDQGMVALKMHVVVGLNQSGKAKEWDRKELNESIQDVSDLMFHVHYANAAHYINRLRYGVLIEDKDKLAEQEPTINSPNNFDILTVGDLTEELKQSSDANVNSNYQAELTKEISNKRFSADIETKNKLSAIVDCDPFSNIDRETKMLMLSDGTVRKIDVIISDNIKSFIERAIEENPEFYDLKKSEKKLLLESYANEILSSASPTTEIVENVG